MLREKMLGATGKAISYLLILTTQAMTAHIAYAQDDMANAVRQANQFAKELTSNRAMPTINNNGDVVVNGSVLMSGTNITGQKSKDYVPAQTDTYGNDAKTLFQGQQAQNKYEEKTLATAETSGEIAYHLVKKSFQTQKPDLTNDPMWNNTDNVLDNLTDIAKGFANCTLDTELVSSGNSYHVPKYETCEKLPAIEESFTIAHDYKIGVIKHHSGPVNLANCGSGCLKAWIGTVGDNYWGGRCLLETEHMEIEVIQPNAILSAVLDRAKFDDYFRVSLNDNIIYVGPESIFPTWQIGKGCERDTSWDRYPNIDITSSFTSLANNAVLRFKNETLVDSGGDGLGGEGFSSIKIHYDPKKIIYNDVWTTLEQIDKALQIKEQIDDGYCTGHITCTSMPNLDANGCMVENGIKVCESDFQSNPIFGLGISPFCKRVDVVSDCGFNDGEICFTNMQGVETCKENSTIERNSCREYEENPECSYVKTECVGGAEGDSGLCYVQEDTYDCGFTATTGQETEEEVLRCDGQVQCIGESCYSPVRDLANEDFGQVSAYLEMLKYARSDMTCEGVPERPFDPESPPDRYYPVTGCPDGYSYNKESDQCLKQLSCDYDDANFYAASIRNGIQVVKANSIIADNKSIGQCLPIEHSGQVYTCGDARNKVGTDTFYEVCTNLATDTTPNSCPDADHSLNPSTGYCEVPPVLECSPNYALVEGDNKFDPSDNSCVSERLLVDKQCSAGWSYVPSRDRCEKTDTTPIVPTCDAGYTLTNGTCVATNTVGATFYCTSGTLNGQMCEDQYTECRFDDRNKVVRGYSLCGGSSYTRWSGTRPSELFKGKLKRSRLVSCEIRDRTYSGYSYEYEVCANLTRKVDANVSCPIGYVLNGGQCTRTISSPVTSTCPNGYTLQGGICSKTDHIAYIPTCYSPWVLHPNKQECWMQPETMPAEASCPSLYPVWNEEEKRCVTDRYESIKTTSLQFNENSQANSEQLAHVQLKQLMTTVLAPFAYLMDAAVPSVVANNDMHETEDSRNIQEKMNDYVAGKFGEVAATMESDLGTYQTAQAQLGARAMAFSAPQAQSYSAPKAMSGSTGGDQNVTCELFKGTHMECKIAVGGMQNCCKNPVAVSLGDYISLTTKMMQMDALSGQVFGIEGYNGVWEIGKDWAVDGASSAWDAISSTWTTGADAATGVTQAGADAATEGMMHTFSQSLMTYTNDFLVQTFGKDVAAMFFQETGKTAAGDAILGASTQMAAVGSALMVVYYAYLAYVVFNLLVNIIYECEEEEMDLAMKRDLLSTHYIGSYCKTEVLFACVEKREVHCSFDSPLSRIMMEQIYMQPQMGLSWGTPESPNCRGIGIDELDKVDWSKVNLDEWIGILVKTDNYVDMVDIDLDSLTGNGSNLKTESDRLDVLERNTERFENVDIDKMKRDIYEDGWNRNH